MEVVEVVSVEKVTMQVDVVYKAVVEVPVALDAGENRGTEGWRECLVGHTATDLTVDGIGTGIADDAEEGVVAVACMEHSQA